FGHGHCRADCLRRTGGTIHNTGVGRSGYPPHVVVMFGRGPDFSPDRGCAFACAGTAVGNAGRRGHGVGRRSGIGGRGAHAAAVCLMIPAQVLKTKQQPPPAPSASPPGTWCVRLGHGATAPTLLVDIRGVCVGLGLLVTLLGASLLCLSLGTAKLSPSQALTALFGNGDAMHIFVVRQLRLDRLVAGVLAGSAFGLAGCLMQTLARNRLATPGIIGIDNGATA